VIKDQDFRLAAHVFPPSSGMPCEVLRSKGIASIR
jgi:hypothetical protein